MSPLLRSGLRHHLRHPTQLALSLAGVVLGVAVVTAMSVAIESARRGFDLSNEAVFGRVTHTLEAGPAGLDEALYVRLRTRLRQLDSAPVVSGRLRAVESGRPLELLGVDPFAEAPLRSHSPTPWDGQVSADLLTRPGGVLASAATAARLGITPGASIQVLAAGRTVALTLLGLLPVENEVQAVGLDDVLVADLATAQEVLGRHGRLSRIDLRVPDTDTDAHGAPLLHRLQALLPPGVRVEPGAARARVREEMTRAFYLNLRMLSLLALVVGMFVIYNAMTFSVVRRRTLIGTLRAVGVTGREILLMVLAEAALLGCVATAVGVPLGAAVADRLLLLITRTIDDLYFAASVREVSLPLEALLAPVLLGITGAVAAALVPALEATRIPPRAALTPSHLERRARDAVPWLAGMGVCGALLALTVLAGSGRSLAAAFLALFLVVAVAAAWTPAATLGIAVALERLLRVPAGGLGAMAVRGLRSGLSRSAVAVAALMVALATTVGVAAMVASFRDSLQDWLATTLAADVYVGVAGRDAGAALPPHLVRLARALPEVSAVSLSRDVDVATGFGEVWLKSVSVDGPRYRGLHMVDGDADAGWRALAGGGVVLASEPFAWRHGLVRGSPLTVHTDAGPRTLRIAGIYRDYGSDRGMLMASLDDYRRWFRDPGVSGMGLQLAEGANAGAVARRLREAAADGQRLDVFDQNGIREASLAVFDRTFAITRVLQWLATLVACVGVLGALMALALERAREMAVLRALGLTRGELMAMLQMQTASMGLVAGLLALPLGALMALVLVHVINRRAFGWGMEFSLPAEILGHTLLVAVGAALLAGLYPAWVMARAQPAQGLRDA